VAKFGNTERAAFVVMELRHRLMLSSPERPMQSEQHRFFKFSAQMSEQSPNFGNRERNYKLRLRLNAENWIERGSPFSNSEACDRTTVKNA
jgi:hypothetical protein